MPREYVRHKPKPLHRLPDETVEMVRQMLRDEVSMTKIARAMRIGRMTVWRIAQKTPKPSE